MIPFVKNKSHIITIALIFCFFNISCSRDSINTYASDEERWLHTLTSQDFRGRKTGTEGCRKASDYIVEELEKMGYSPESEEFTYRDSISMRNIVVEIPGDSDSILIVGAHYDGAVNSSKYQAANDNASGVIALLSIAKDIQPGQNTVLLCFWDGEETTEGKSFNGSSYFVEHFDNDKLDCIKWYCNIDCCGRQGDSTYLYYSDDLEQMFADLTLGYDESLNIIRKVQNKESSDYIPFKKKKISFWGWNDCDVSQYIHSSDDAVEFISLAKINSISSITISIING